MPGALRVGLDVWWDYRSGKGYGRIVAVAVKAATQARTKYKILETDRWRSPKGHKGPRYVYHYGAALSPHAPLKHPAKRR